jgi:hypothetical protein
MEILFIYLEKYRNFSKQGFNFSAEFNFTTEKREGDVSITIDKNPDYIPNFFENENILNVSAVIGQNGAGKSNILEFIRNELPFDQGGLRSNCIVALGLTSKQRTQHFFLYVNNLPHVRIDDRTKQFNITHLSPSETKTSAGEKIETFDTIDELEKASIIFYSNHFDLRFTSSLLPVKFEGEYLSSIDTEFYNISTLAMLSKDQQNYAKENYVITRDKFIDKTDAYKAREIGRNIEFITRPQRFKLLEFKLPESLLITIQSEDEQQFSGYDRKGTNELFKFLQRFESEFKPQAKYSGQLFLNRLCRAILFNFYKNSLETTHSPFDLQYLESVGGQSFFEFFMRFFANTVSNSPVDHEKERAPAILELVNYVYEVLIKSYNERFIAIDNDNGAVALPVSFGDKDNIEKFVDLYVKSKGYGDFLNFQWRGLSTGEQAMLTLFSRFFELSDARAPRSLRLREHLIVLIDEGDVHFHPEWQRKYLQLLLEFFPQIYPGRTIQIILTSNTPYLASDLPKSHITFLKIKRETSTKVLPPNNDRKETFASNIHSLLSDSFYLEEGLIGEFAKRRINKIIDFLKTAPSDLTNLNSNKINEYKKIINIIGEPVIRNRLIELWTEKFGIAEQIEFYQRRISELREEAAKRNQAND